MRDLQRAERQVDVGVQRRGHVGAETPHGIERNEAVFDLPSPGVGLTVGDRDARRAREAGFAEPPGVIGPPASRVEMHFHAREARRRGDDWSRGRGRGLLGAEGRAGEQGKRGDR